MRRARIQHLKIAWRYLEEFKWLLVLCLILVLCASAFEGLSVALVVPLLEQMGSGNTATGISRFTRGFFTAFGLEQTFINLLLLFSVLTLAKFSLAEWARYENRVLSASLRYRMRGKIFENLMALPLQFYYRRRTGDIISSIHTSTTEAAALVENTIRLVNAAAFATAYIAIQFSLSVWMTVIALGFTFISYYFVYPRFSIGFTQGEEEKGIFDRTVSFLQDRLSGIKTLKAFGNEGLHVAEFDRLGQGLRRLAINIQKNKIVAQLFGEPFTTCAVILMLLVAVEVLHLSVVELLAFFYAYSLLVPRIKAINTEYLTISEKMPHFEKVHELIEQEGKTYLHSGDGVIKRLEAGIQFSDVWFRYPGIEESVLKGVTFTIERLHTTALVGASGVGKTTIADLILRLHDPSAGQLLVNGDDLREFRTEDWHRLVSVVEQEPYLFYDSVRNNIRYGKLDASEAEVREAARLAHADRFIEALPRGYDTIVGERGMTLSAGQRQRIALARAIIRNPEVLILDEATSALDSESEQLIQEAINELKSRCTLVIIAHRLSTIVNADQIVILDNGRVAEEGSHHELLQRKGLYQRYYTLQMELEPVRRGEGG